MKNSVAVTQLTIPAVKISEVEMQNAFYRAFCARYELVATNLYFGWCGGEMDILGLRKSGFIDEIEIKLSVSDFRADFIKTIIVRDEHTEYLPEGMLNRPRSVLKHECLPVGAHSCNYFSFYLPGEIAGKCEIPDYAGLYVFDGPGSWHSIREVKKAPRLHSRKISDSNKYRTARKMHYRCWDILLRRENND